MNHSPPPSGIDYVAEENSAEFKALKKSHRSVVLPLSAAFLAWYFLYVLLGAYAHDFMATPLFGRVNLGIVLGLLQFVSTFAITMGYVSYANRKLDPQAAAIREDLAAKEAAAS